MTKNETVTDRTPLEHDLAKRAHVITGVGSGDSFDSTRSFSGPVSGCAKHHARFIGEHSAWEAMLRECAERGEEGWDGDGGMASPEEVGRRLAEEGHSVAVIYWPSERVMRAPLGLATGVQFSVYQTLEDVGRNNEVARDLDCYF